MFEFYSNIRIRRKIYLCLKGQSPNVLFHEFLNHHNLSRNKWKNLEKKVEKEKNMNEEMKKEWMKRMKKWKEWRNQKKFYQKCGPLLEYALLLQLKQLC